MNEAKLRKDAARGTRAKALLENDLLQEAFENVEKIIDASWKGSKSFDHEARHNAYLMYRLLQEFKDYFTRVVANGDRAGKDLNLIIKDSKIRGFINGNRSSNHRAKT